MAPTSIVDVSSKVMSRELSEPSNAILSEAYMNEDKGPVLVGVSIAMAILTTFVIAGRYYSKRFGGAPLGLDDVFLTAAYVVNLGMCALGILMVKVGGVGKHVEEVEEKYPEQLVGWAKTILAFEIVYFTSVALPKLAIICLYLRVFNWRGLMRNLALLLLAVTASTGISLIVAACFQCRPIAFWWDREIEGGSCFDVQRFFHAQSIPSIVLDLFIMALPVHTIWGLKLPAYKRVALMIIFLVASFGIVASVFRAVAFFDVSAFDDRTFASVTLVGWSIAETSTYIITACLPSLKPLISHYAPQWLKSMVRKTLSHASNSLTKHYHTRKDEDEVELTARSKRLNNKKSSMSASRETVRDEWPSGHRREGSDGTLGFGEEPHGTRTVVRNSGIHIAENDWGEDGIKVKTEVKIERSRSSVSVARKAGSPSRI